MRIIETETIGKALYRIIACASFELGEKEKSALFDFRQQETSPAAVAILDQLLENAKIAAKERRPLCQDTGVTVVFIDLGQEVELRGEELHTVINHWTGRACTELGLRASMVEHPLDRSNSGNNTPAIVHINSVPGNQIKLTFAAKGGGCENMSRIGMLTPAAGKQGVINFVVDTVIRAGANPCPPIIVGVGLGGNFELSALMAKKALLRSLGEKASNYINAELEQEIFCQLQESGIGPQGLGGRTTCLAVHINSHPCHIASLPIAVNIDCHSHRHGEIII